MNLEELQIIAQKVKQGETAFGTARQLLRCFGFNRRGARNNHKIRVELDQLGLTTSPAFETTWGEERFAFQSKDEPLTTSSHTQNETAGKMPDSDGMSKDPLFRVGRLESANKEPVSVHTNTTLRQAATTMLMNDFSQLPVIDGNTLKGMINWKTIGSRLSRECEGDEVRHFMEKANEISADESMIKAIDLIVQNDYVLVRSKGKITGIVTTHDLSAQFRQLIEPFLLLAEIESQIRSILVSQLTLEEIKGAKDPGDTEREVTCITDLSFGEYMRIFQNPEMWEKLGLYIDRKSFTDKLDEIRNIRNDVMHFGPDPLNEEEIVTLRNFWAFLDALTR